MPENKGAATKSLFNYDKKFLCKYCLLLLNYKKNISYTDPIYKLKPVFNTLHMY